MKTRRQYHTPQARLADYIVTHASSWVQEWLTEVRLEPTTSAYRGYEDTAELLRDTEALYHYLALWLRGGVWDPRIDPHYQRIGRDRRREGFPLAEVVSAILIAKRHLWNGIIEDNQLSVALELEVSKAISLFYDKAIYHTVVGYTEAVPEPVS